MTKVSGGVALVEALRLEGATHVFGVIGTAMLEAFDALYDRPEVRYVGVRHEQNAVHMADAYARVSRRPGVVLAGQPGPGATNLVTGLAEARLAFSPVVAIAGDTASSQRDRNTFQEVDQDALFAAVTKRTVTVRSAARIPEYVHEAFRTSNSGRRGPVVVNVPGDLLAEQIEPDYRAPASGVDEPAAPSPAAVARAAELLNGASRPLILAGAGVKWADASARLVALAEELGCPVAASAGNGDVMPNDHTLYVGQVGRRGNAVATRLAQTADVILALGTRLGYNTTLFSNDVISPDAQIIHVDVDATAVGRHFPAVLHIVADAGATAEALLPAVRASTAWAEWTADARAERKELLAERTDAARGAGELLSPAVAYAALQHALPRNVIVTVDTGTISLHATDTVQTFEPPSLLTPLDFGLVGFSYAAGLGAKAAAPHRPVVSIIGDGGFGMSMCEIGTAVAAGLPTVTVVLNNGCWGAEKAYQRDFFDARYVGADIVNPSFDRIAHAFGIDGVRVETADDVSTAVSDALASDRPAVIEIPVDPETITSFRRDAFSHRVKVAG